ncbi:MAG: enoyl-CoA hydratase-related protein [Chloroflexota bacterium]
MMYVRILYEKHDSIARIILIRQDAPNTMDSQLAVELTEACQEIAGDEEPRVVVITSLADVFCLGVEVAQGGPRPEVLARVANAVHAVASLDMPVIAAINGNALNEGLELALACDIRIASEAAEFGLAQVSRGAIPMCGGTQRLPRIIGRGRATEMVLSGETIGAQEAYRIGLVNGVAPREDLMAMAERLAGRIARNAPIAARYAKEAILQGLDKPLDQGMRLEADLSILLQTTEDRAEGLDAFLTRRTPEYRGR